MKKFISVIIILVLSLSVSACSSTVTDEDKDKVKGDIGQEQNSDPENSGDVEWSAGSTSGQVYTSTFGGFKLTAPDDGWVFSGEEEILSMMDIALDSDILSDSQKRAAEIGKQRTIYDAILSETASGSNILIMYENLSLTPGASSYDAMQYAKTLKTQLGTVDSYTVDEPQTIKFLDENYVRLDCSAVAEGVAINQCYLIKKIDNYILAICITPGVTSGTTVDSMLSMFSKI